MGPLEIILIIVVIALVFGASKLPQLGKGLGQGIKEFKRETGKTDADTTEGVTPITDVSSRQIDPVTGAPLPTERETVGNRRA
ncbi:twin-arginine translocase TatA/TatE family subunit [Deinococcus humi]|uniref:Sec-independent protein translocase protein TatA n=1 Tax=Deinococcus humi TaxID=662880 RepID=A0A7W8ND12_9DEIO|nr:twin-arginine translocase TatA/TatE family subunit [Deinococcus humi]MBB5361140.1 sec-independent protein translocase protein TatA [Deinococcus humi]GGO18601.1 Sec-independent protein translocase protein TatA [Deinococcus humi]